MGTQPLQPVTLAVNGSHHQVLIEPRRTLLDALRHDLGLTGAKMVCDMGDCGACTVIVDGKAMYACLLLAVDCDGREITTIEGLARGNELDPVQAAFIREDAFQCGCCTSGQIMSLRPARYQSRTKRRPDPARGDGRYLPLRGVSDHPQGRTGCRGIAGAGRGHGLMRSRMLELRVN